jgi:hypothetical protein
MGLELHLLTWIAVSVKCITKFKCCYLTHAQASQIGQHHSTTVALCVIASVYDSQQYFHLCFIKNFCLLHLKTS